MKPTSVRILVLVLLVVAGQGCKKRTPLGPPPPPPARPTRDAGKSAAKAKVSPEVERAQAERDIRSTIARWVAAQNNGDFAAYTALYEQNHFRGQKRTKSGKTTRADWAAWRADRAKMFDKGKMTVAAEDVTIRTWLDKGATLRPGVSEARFVQRWRNPRYTDHGTKVLQFLRSNAGMAILYEDMLTSAPGWDEAPAVDAGLGFEMDDKVPVPKTDDEAMALWRKLNITQETVYGATFDLDRFAGGEIMAEALLRHGSFVCKRYVDYDECGQSTIEWEKVPPETGWEDACVQREAAEWAIGKVTAKRLPAMAEALIKLASIPPPEEIIPDALVKRFDDMPEKLRRQVIRAMLAVRCDKEGCDEWHPEQHLTALTDKSRIALYEDGDLTAPARQAAIDGVDLLRNPEVLVEVFGDETLDTSVREKLWDALDAQKPTVQERALRLAAEDRSCPFAMSAIEQLARRGKKDLLPRAGRGDPSRVVCLLLNATDQERADREFSKLLPKRGKILFTEESRDELDGEGGSDQSSEEEVPVRDVWLGTLPEALREHVGPVETYTAGHSETVDVIFDANGLLEAVTKKSWSGCPC